MTLDAFTPGGRYAQPSGGLAQSPQQPAQPSGALAQPNRAMQGDQVQQDPTQEGWLAHIPQGLLETLTVGQQIGFGEAFLRKYGKQFETLENAAGLVGMVEQGTPPPLELPEYIDGDELDSEIYGEAALGALAQAQDHVIKGGLF